MTRRFLSALAIGATVVMPIDQAVSQPAASSNQALPSDHTDTVGDLSVSGPDRDGINDAKEEAAQEYDGAMSTATVEMITGVSQTTPKQADPLERSRRQGAKATARDSDTTQIEINAKQAEIDKIRAEMDMLPADATAERDRKKAQLDSIQKMLDIMRGMNPRI